MQYIKGYLVLYVVLMILIQMIPREGFRKYIRFFSEMILVIGILTPVLQFFGKEDFFLEKKRDDLPRWSLNVPKIIMK